MSFLVIEGRVKLGRRRGTKLGFPTINLAVPRSINKTDWGVYFSLIKIEAKVYPALTHLGTAKTFFLHQPRCESYLLTLKKDLYRQKVKKILLFKFREVEKFSHFSALKKQIRRDVKAAHKYFGL